MSYKPNISFDTIVNNSKGEIIYPVYILSRVVRELIGFCKATTPKEALGFLVGNRILVPDHNQISYTRIIDWVTGSIDSTHISANFTTDGLQQANLFLDNRYGLHREQYPELPTIVGIVHSHPFGSEPFFSTTDLDTFLSFPYDTKGNVFILIDSEIPYFKVFKIMNINEQKTLQMVPWIEYSPVHSDLDFYNSLDFESITDEEIQPLKNPKEKEKSVDNETIIISDNSKDELIEKHSEEQMEDRLFDPPKIEDLSSPKRKKKNQRLFFE